MGDDELMPGRTESWLEIDLDAIEHNVRVLVEKAAPAELMAVVKADACGHGAREVAPAVLRAGARHLGVARVDEAVSLREAGINVSIYILGYLDASSVPEVVEGGYAVDPRSVDVARTLSRRAVEKGSRVTVHVEVDTGLKRWGVPVRHLEQYVRSLAALPGLRVEGIYTHFANLDEGDYEDTERAFREFLKAAGRAEEVLGKRLLKHVCNTAGTLALPRMHLDMVRPGVGLYGLLPLPLDSHVDLWPALSLKSTIGMIREIKAGESAGYGATYTAPKDTRIAVVPLGFGDGFPPGLGGRGNALVRGVRVPIVGKVSTDAVILDIGSCQTAAPGDEVVFIGEQEGERILAEEIAHLLGTFVDPVLINLGRGLTREYKRRGSGFEHRALKGDNIGAGGGSRRVETLVSPAPRGRARLL